MNRLTVITGCICICLFVTIYKIKHKVLSINQRHKLIKKKIVEHEETIRVLKAEWTYLNDPLRLQKLSFKYLDLKPIKALQITTLSALESFMKKQKLYNKDALKRLLLESNNITKKVI
ncbi:MAG: cell division protein FtsL [Alphaproteobacteria bacterium]